MQLSTNESLEPRLRTVFDRIRFASDRVRWEDELIDGMIALEALMGDKGPSEQYKVSLRTAILCSDSTNDRREIVRRIKAAYGLRSKVVHGGSLKSGDEAEGRVYSQLICDTVRSIVKVAIQRGWNRTRLPDPEAMDGWLLRGSIDSVEN